MTGPCRSRASAIAQAKFTLRNLRMCVPKSCLADEYLHQKPSHGLFFGQGDGCLAHSARFGHASSCGKRVRARRPPGLIQSNFFRKQSIEPGQSRDRFSVLEERGCQANMRAEAGCRRSPRP
jgi:hypothetical protein